MKSSAFSTFAITLSAALALGACKKAKTEEAAPAAPATEATAPAPAAATGTGYPAGKYDIDAGHSAFIWKAHHMGAGYTYGWFKDVSGNVVVDADPSKQAIEFTVKVDSLDSRDAKRDEHLRGPDFFNAAQFPTITFKSTKVEAAGEALKVTGDLSIHGVTKSIEATVTPTGTAVDPWKNTRVGYETKLTIARADYGLGFMPEGIGANIDIIVSIEGAKK